MRPQPEKAPITSRITSWVGSPASLVLHTLVFLGFFLLVLLGALALETMLLILTTVVSLEAIYLAIFIQMTVNTNTLSLREVEEDIDELQEDVEEMTEDLDEIHEDDERDEARDVAQAEALHALTDSVKRILEDLEALKRGK